MGLMPDKIDDFVNLTTSKLYRFKWTDISLEHPEYVSSQLIDQKKVTEEGGPNISFRLKTKNTGNAINSGLYAEDKASVEDVTIAASVPWSCQTTSWSYDIDEALFQSDRETIINILQVRDHDAMSDMAELNEENLWSEPASSADTRPMGVPFWVRKDASTTVDGAFNGGNPTATGLTGGCAGVDSTIYPRWRNWTFGYSATTIDDLVRKVKKAMFNTTFKPPVPHPELGFGKSEQAMYTTYRVAEPLERLAETRNDNLGNDVARYIGSVVIGGVPVKAVPYLEANDSSDPIYGLNWKTFRPYVKRGANMRRSPVKQAPKQHNVRSVFIDNWMNYICVNRRSLFVGSKS